SPLGSRDRGQGVAGTTEGELNRLREDRVEQQKFQHTRRLHPERVVARVSLGGPAGAKYSEPTDRAVSGRRGLDAEEMRLQLEQANNVRSPLEVGPEADKIPRLVVRQGALR